MRLLEEPFHPELFSDHNHYQEGLFNDRKVELYQLEDNPLAQKHRHDLVEDLLAFANMSYRFGRDCTILFGINNQGIITSVKGQSTRLKFLENVDWENEASVMKLFEKIEDDIIDYAKKYITPNILHLAMKHGDVIQNGEKVLVAYLVIRAEQNNNKAFSYCGKKDLSYTDPDEKKHSIRSGDSRYRMGQRNEPLLGKDFDNWKAHTICPVISLERWEEYIRNLKSRIADSKPSPINLQGYIEPRITIDGNETKLLDYVRNTFLASKTEHLIVIEGQAGMGKSIFLQRFVYDRALQVVDSIDKEKIDPMPVAWVPIFVEMREKTIPKEKLTQKIINWAVKDLGGNSASFERAGCQWLICLDAIDELDARSAKNLWVSLNDFMMDFPNVKIVLTSRPDTVDYAGWKGHVVSIEDLTDQEVENYLQSNIVGDDTEKAPTSEMPNFELEWAKQLLSRNDELSKLIRTPLYLHAFTQAINGYDRHKKVPFEDKETSSQYHFKGEIDPRAVTVDIEYAVDETYVRHTEPLISDEGAVTVDNEYAVDETYVRHTEPPISDDGMEEDKDEDKNEDENKDPIIDLTKILRNILLNIWEHDQKHFQQAKETLSGIYPLHQLGMLALVADGDQRIDLITGRRNLGLKHLNRFLSLGFLTTDENDWLVFPNLLMQSLLAAQKLDMLWRISRNKAKNRIQDKIDMRNPFWITLKEFHHAIRVDPAADALFEDM